MTLTFKEKELVNIGASVAAGCMPCTNYHFEKVREAGASDEEIRDAISWATSVRDSAREVMEHHGLHHLGITEEIDLGEPVEETSRIRELVTVAAAFAVNCTINLKKHLAAAETVGITDEEIQAVLKSALFIQGEAAHYVDQIVKLTHRNEELQLLLEELQETQAQLVQSEKMAALGKLVASVVHEMNTPIGAINSTTDVVVRSADKILEVLEGSHLRDQIKEDPRLKSSLRALHDNAPITLAASERLTRTISSLKSFARIDTATFQQADLHECIESTLTLIEHEIGEQVEVVKAFGEIPRIACFPGELNQVFLNLLTNALQALEGSGRVTVKTYLDQERVHVEIADSGVGIPPEELKSLFDPGFAKGGARVRAGLGLFISYNIVRKHRGEIKVESEVGKGSAFTVVLPQDLERQPPVQDSSPVSGTTAGAADRCAQLSEGTSPAERCCKLEDATNGDRSKK